MIFRWKKSENLSTGRHSFLHAAHRQISAILEDEIIGKAATDVYNDAQKMIDQIINEKWLQIANGIIDYTCQQR